MENEDSPSDEESDEQNNLIFTETASSAGSESPHLNCLYKSTSNILIMGFCRLPKCTCACSSEINFGFVCTKTILAKFEFKNCFLCTM